MSKFVDSPGTTKLPVEALEELSSGLSEDESCCSPATMVAVSTNFMNFARPYRVLIPALYHVFQLPSIYNVVP
jgi:hypothetical protein